MFLMFRRGELYDQNRWDVDVRAKSDYLKMKLTVVEDSWISNSGSQSQLVF